MDKKDLISKMTLQEKASLCSGADFWHTKTLERLGLPAVMVSDGPHGLRKQAPDADVMDVNHSIRAVCFPAACATACSFDRQMIYKMGETIGSECRAEKVSVILGPAVNMKRSPLCGRNFEYFSEDPCLTGEMAANFIQGVQSREVGTSIKHFCANNQEERRMTVSSEVDERTLREIYLTAFEKAVKQAKPWTVMCSYNRINGVYASENRKLLTDILRDEWGFKGLVMSDWGAVSDRVRGVAAGLDLEMPSSGGVNDAEIVKAVQNGTLSEADLDKAAERVLDLVDLGTSHTTPNGLPDWEADHEFARRMECESMVLLKNEDAVLPLNRKDKIAFIGKFAETPRYQGGGSSHINSFRVTGALEAVKKVADVSYAKGFGITADTDDDPALLEEAVRTAAEADVAVIFAGLPEYMESEGFDRKHMRMPENQNRLIEAVAQAQPNTVVVLHNGSPVEMPWIDRVKGLLELYLGGEAVGSAAVDVLFGDKNPCGRLAETIPVKLSDNPSYLFYPGEGNVSEYREGIFIGYRYYDKKEIPVQFPFGHGLSYTTFEYGDLNVSRSEIRDGETLDVTVKVRNSGTVFGKEVVQLYVRDNQGAVIRPVKELKGFEKVALNPGEEKTVGFQLDRRAFAYYNERVHDWCVQNGTFEILIGRSSRAIELSAEVTIKSAPLPLQKFTLDSTLGDLMACGSANPVVEQLSKLFEPTGGGGDGALGEGTAEMNESMFRDMPLRSIISFSNTAVTRDMLLEMLDTVNANL